MVYVRCYSDFFSVLITFYPALMSLIKIFRRGCDTVLGETSDPREIFVVTACEDISFGLIAQVATVQFSRTPTNWSNLGGEPLPIDDFPDDGTTFFYQKTYDPIRGRFEDVPASISCPETEEQIAFCECCERQRLLETLKSPSVGEPLDCSKTSQDEVHSNILLLSSCFSQFPPGQIYNVFLSDEVWRLSL